MKKSELVDDVAAESGHNKSIVRDILSATDRCVRRTVSSGDSVFLFGLGKISVTRRPQRTAANFGNGPVLVDACNALRFRPSSGLVAAANGQ